MNTPLHTSTTQRAINALNAVMDELQDAARALGTGLTANGEKATLPVALASMATGLYEEAEGRLANAVPNQPDVACCRGCTACCYLPVRTDPGTVLRLAEHVRETWTPIQQRALERRVNAHIAAVEANPEAPPSARPPCPFLVDDMCSVHELRPLVCRAMNAFDVDDCLKATDTGKVRGAIRGNPVPSMIAEALRKGVDEALSDEGYVAEQVDFTPALKYALETPDAAGRWAENKKFMP